MKCVLCVAAGSVLASVRRSGSKVSCSSLHVVSFSSKPARATNPFLQPYSCRWSTSAEALQAITAAYQRSTKDSSAVRGSVMPTLKHCTRAPTAEQPHEARTGARRRTDLLSGHASDAWRHLLGLQKMSVS